MHLGKSELCKDSDILFSSLVESYLEEMAHRLKPTTMENKRFIISGKPLPYFGRLKVCDIDTIKIRKWQNGLISYRDEGGKPFSLTYLKTVNNHLDAGAVRAVFRHHTEIIRKASRQAEPVPQDASGRRKHLKLCTDCGILNIKKDTCW